MAENYLNWTPFGADEGVRQFGGYYYQPFSSEANSPLVRYRPGQVGSGQQYEFVDPATGMPTGQTGAFRRPGNAFQMTGQFAKDMAPLALAAVGANALGGTLGSFGSFGGAGAATAPAGAAGAGAAGAGAGAAGAGAGAAGAGAAGAGGSMLGGKMFEYLIPAAASLLGSSMSASAAKDAAGQSAAAADKATALQKQMYEESVARQQPFLAGGTEDYNRLRSLMSGGPGAAQQFLQMDPGYGFRLGEGLKAMERGAAARGGLMSGAALKAGQRYGQDLASQEYGAAYNRLAGLADVGPRAAGVMSGLGQNYAGNVGNIMMGQGQTAANAALARGSAYSGGLNQLGYLAGRYYGQPQGGGYMAPVESRDLSNVGGYYGPAMPGMPGP